MPAASVGVFKYVKIDLDERNVPKNMCAFAAFINDDGIARFNETAQQKMISAVFAYSEEGRRAHSRARASAPSSS